MAAGTETFAFPTEINRLLTLITTTFHSSKEIFFRELITNASDALGKIRLESLTDQSELDARNLSIHIFPDKVSNALTIFDNGVGMTKSELVNNLGRLGTKSARADVSMTGFGFYSVYLVAKRVVVTTKRQQGQQYVWESEAGGSFTVRKGGASYGRGTMITLFLKEDQLEYLDEHRLKDLVEKYSESISYPISVWPKAIGNFSSDADADSWIRGVLSASEYRRLFFGYDRVFIMYTVRGVPPYDRMRAVRYLLHKLDVVEQGLQGICPLPGGYTVPEGSDDDDEGHVQ